MSKVRVQRWVILLILLLGLLPPIAGAAQQSPRVAFLFPGEDEIVVSPIQVSAQIEPDPQGFIRLALLDPSGRTISRQLYQSSRAPQGSLNTFETFLSYEAPSQPTNVLLTLSLYDREDRPIALRSMLLILRPGEVSQMEAQRENGGWLKIVHPVPLQVVTGDMLLVEGTIIPLTANPVFFELITVEGRVLTTRQLAVQNPGISADFEISLPYQVSAPEEDVRLVIRQSRSPFGAPGVLDSILLTLSP